MKTITSYLGVRSVRSGSTDDDSRESASHSSDVLDEDIENRFGDLKVAKQGCQQQRKNSSAMSSPISIVPTASFPPPPLVCLPPEVLSVMLGLLSAREVLKLERTCRRLLMQIRFPSGSSQFLWNGMLQRHFGTSFSRLGSAATSGVPSRNDFLHLRNLRLRPMASVESPKALSDSPNRTPSLRSVPQTWRRRSSPFSPLSEVENVVPLAGVEECDHHAEPVAVLPPKGDVDFVERYNFAVLETNARAVEGDIASTKSKSPFFMPRQCNGWEVDFELCYAGWNGGLLGIVACDPKSSGSASVSLGQSSSSRLNVWCFDFFNSGNRGRDIDEWWSRSELDGHHCPVMCNMRSADVGLLTASESPTRSQQKFRLRFECRMERSTRGSSLDLFLLNKDDRVVRFVARIGDADDTEREEMDDERSENESIGLERLRSYASRGFDFRPFCGFSPLNNSSEDQPHRQPEKSHARVLRVVYM